MAKTVEATGAELEAIEKGLRDLATQIPVDVRQLSELARLAGQFGIAAGDVVAFTRTMALLSATIDDLDVEVAASALARLSTIMRVSADDFDNLGAVLTDLGNKFASAEGDILNVSTRIAGMGRIIGLTAQEVLGISNAIAVVVGPQGLEAAGTATQKVFSAINTAVVSGNAVLEKFAEVAGLTATQFKELFERDASEAFIRFVEGLGREGRRAAIVLEELGLKDARLVRSFLQLAGAGDLLRRSVATANTAFEENVALVNEANKRFDTLISRFQVFRNILLEVGIQLGEILKPGLIAAIDKLSAALERIATIVAPGFRALADALGPLTEGFVSFIQGIAFLVNAVLLLFSQLLAKGAPALGALAESLGRFINILADIFAPAFNAAGEAIAVMVDVLSTALGLIKGDLLASFELIAVALGEALEHLTVGFAQALPQLVPLIAEMAASFVQFMQAIGPAFANFATALIGRILQIATAFVNILSVVGGPLLEVFAEVFRQIGFVVLEVSRIFQSFFEETLSKLAFSLVELLQLIGPKIFTALAHFVANISFLDEKILKLVDSLGVALTTTLDALVPLFENMDAILGSLIDIFVALIGPVGRVVVILAEGLAAVLPAVLGALEPVAKILADVLHTFADQLPDLIVSGALALVEFLVILVDVMKELGPKNIAKILGLGIAFAGILKLLKPIIPTLAALIFSLGPLFDLVAAILPIFTNFTALLATLLLAVFGAAGGFQELFEILKPVFEIIGEALNEAFHILVEAMRPVVEAMQVLRPLVSEIAEAIAPLIVLIAKFAGELIQRLGPVLVEAVANFLTLAIKILPRLVPLVEKMVNFFIEFIDPIFQLVEMLMPVMGDLLLEIADSMLDVLAAIEPLIQPLLDLAAQFTYLALISIPPFIAILEHFLIPALNFLVENGLIPVITVLAQMATKLLELTVLVTEFFVKAIFSTVHKVISAFATLAEALNLPFADSLREAEKAFEKFKDEVNKSLEEIKDKQIIVDVTPHFPPEDYFEAQPPPRRPVTFAHGGFLRAGQWAWVGEEGPELIRLRRGGGEVFDARTSARMSQSADQRPIEVNVYEVANDPNATAEAVSTRVASEAAR